MLKKEVLHSIIDVIMIKFRIYILHVFAIFIVNYMYAQNNEPIIDVVDHFSNQPHTCYLSCSISQDGGTLASGDPVWLLNLDDERNSITSLRFS